MEHGRCFYERYRGTGSVESTSNPAVPKLQTKIEKEVEEKFSQDWRIYRVATHKLGGIHLVADMKTKYTIKDLYDMLEIMDVYDSLYQNALDKEEKAAKLAQAQSARK